MRQTSDGACLRGAFLPQIPQGSLRTVCLPVATFLVFVCLSENEFLNPLASTVCGGFFVIELSGDLYALRE